MIMNQEHVTRELYLNPYPIFSHMSVGQVHYKRNSIKSLLENLCQIQAINNMSAFDILNFFGAILSGGFH